MLTENCPVGLKAVVRRLSRIAGMVLSVMTPSFAGAQPNGSYASSNLNDAGIDITIIDPQGNAILDGRVTLRDADGEVIHGKVDKNGRLRLGHRLSGRYTLTATAPGFTTLSRKVDLRHGQTLSYRMALWVGASVGVIVIDDPPKPLDDFPIAPMLAPQGRGPAR